MADEFTKDYWEDHWQHSQGRAHEELHREEHAAVGRDAEIVYFDEVRMFQLRQRARFEPRHTPASPP